MSKEIRHVELRKTAGYALQAEIELDGQTLVVMDEISDPGGAPAIPGRYAVGFSPLSIDFDKTWEDTFSGNSAHEKRLEQLAGWDYLGLGQIVAIKPVVIDFGILKLAAGPWSNDPRIVGEFVRVKISCLAISQDQGEARSQFIKVERRPSIAGKRWGLLRRWLRSLRLARLEKRALRLLDQQTAVAQIPLERRANIRDLIIHGEVGIGVECLIDNLFDSSEPPADPWLSELERIARRAGVGKRYIDTLQRIRARWSDHR